jgi:uncharacterized repeat protein (TIGR02543 family)
LRAKFYATNSTNGTPGTYTRASGSNTWTRVGNPCTVTFDSNGGSAVSPITVGDGNKISAPTVPTKDGYTFGGWYKESDLINQWDFNTDIVTTDIILYAKFSINHTVTFNTDNGTPVPVQQTIRDGGLVTRPATNPSKTGYTFDNWYKDSGFSTLWNFNTDTVTTNTTIYAKFNINKYTVTFFSNGGSNVSPITEVVYNTTISAPPAPTKTVVGYGSFVGWYSNYDLTTPFVFDSTPITGNITLYAKWNLVALNIGDTGPGGGKIFYVSTSGFIMGDNNETCHYLEAAPNDLDGTFRWATKQYENTSISTDFDVGYGRRNTTRILVVDAEAPAAKACREYNGGGKNDWFLPSRYELNQLYDNRSAVGNLGASFYWSSSQGTYNTSPGDSAWRYRFATPWPGEASVEKYINELWVRAIRAF